MATKRVSIIVQARDLASRSVNKITGSFRSLGRFLRGPSGLLGTLTRFFGLFASAQFLRSSVDAFSEQQNAVEKLRTSLVNTGKDGARSVEQIVKAAGDLQRITRAGDEAIVNAVEALNTLAGALTTPDLIEAQKVIVALGDTFFGGDYRNAAVLLGKTLGSTTNALTRYGIEVDTSGTATEKLQEILGSDALRTAFEVSKAQATTLQGRLAQLSNAWGDLKEAIGEVLVSGTDAEDTLGTLIDRVVEWTERIEENRDVVALWVRAIGAGLKFAVVGTKEFLAVVFEAGMAAGNAGLSIVNSLVGVVGTVGNIIIRVANLVVAGVEGVAEESAKAVNRFLPKALQIDEDVELFRFAEIPVDEFFDRASDFATIFVDDLYDLKQNADDFADSLRDVAEAAGLAFFAEGRVNAQRRGASSTGPSTTPPGTGKDRFEDVPELEFRTGRADDAAGAGARPFQPFAGGVVSPEDMLETFGIIEHTNDELERGVSIWQRIGQNIVEATENSRAWSEVQAEIISQVAQGIPNAFESATRAAIEGNESVGAALKGALLGAIAAVARAEAQFYAAKATAALGQGLLGDPRGFAAAAKFLAASAAFSALAGALSAGAAGGGGGAGGRGGATGAQSDRIGEFERPEATLIIEGGDHLDMSDPRTEAQMKKALEDIGNRRVTVIRRTP